MDERVNVTKTFLPKLNEYESYLKSIWDSGNLTNQGPLLKRFEHEVEDYLNIQNFHFVSNGTIALQVALRSLELTEGEIITTPFSYVATTSSILWERCTPIFVDIEPNTFCIDPDKIEAAITANTRAIMPVHVFGFPCDVDAIDAIATKYDLKVIYDAAHAFGVEYKGKPITSYGDISTYSFHATKLFHTIEGGGIVVRDKSVSRLVERVKRFGHDGDEHYVLGINAKASEFQAAMGLCNLRYLEENIKKRKVLYETYNLHLSDKYSRPSLNPESKHNYAYYPVVFENEAMLLSTVDRLNQKNIFPRRYFYPSLNQLPYITDAQHCTVSEEISKRVLCLPLFSELDEEIVIKICEIMNV